MKWLQKVKDFLSPPDDLIGYEPSSTTPLNICVVVRAVFKGRTYDVTEARTIMLDKRTDWKEVECIIKEQATELVGQLPGEVDKSAFEGEDNGS